jgi:hypothetical protein
VASEPSPLFNPERQALNDQLLDVSPRLAGLYRRLIRLVDEDPQADESLARASLVGHCVRELMNRLPDVLADVPDMLDPVSPKTSQLLRQLQVLSEKHSDVLAKVTDLTNGDSGEGIELIPIPRPLYESLRRIIHAAEQETGRAQERDAVVVARARTASGPAYERWRAARKFFMDFTHLDNHVGQDDRAIPTDEQILEHLEAIEATLAIRLTKFFDNRRLLDDFLAEANRPAGDQGHGESVQYVSPERTVVRNLLTRIGSLPLRRVFYRGLQNPLWVTPLADEGAFKNPPEPRMDNEGNVREEPWPEMDFLIRMAQAVPREVVDVGLTLAVSKNSWVKRGLVEIAATVPAEVAASLAVAFRQWGHNNFGWRTDPRHLVTMTEKLLIDGQHKLGMKFATALFQPKKLKAPTAETSDCGVGLDDYWYEESLPRIAEALGNRRLGTLVLWLEAYEKVTGKFDDKAGTDFSYIGRAEIGARQTGPPGVETALIDAVRNAARRQMAVAPTQTVAALMRSKLSLVNRICLFVTADALRNAEPDSREALVSAVHPLIDRPEFGLPEFRIEFGAFLRATSAALGPEKLLPLAVTLERGPLGSLERLKERLAVQLDDSLDIDAEAESYTARWRHRLLSTVGKDALPATLGEQLQDLDQQFGVIENPCSPDFAMTSWSGPESVLGQNDIAAMAAQDLLRHLETWHPDPQQWHGPSHEGQGRELTAVVTDRPDLFDGLTNDILTLRPTYLRAVLRGWENACAAGHELPWPEVVAVIQRTLELPDRSPFQPEGSEFDDDPDYSAAKDAAVRLTVTMLQKRAGHSVPPLSDVMILAPTILSMVGDQQLRTDYLKTAPRDMDAFTLSVNRTLPRAVRALVALTGWNGFNAEDGPVIKSLDELLGRDDPHGAVAAVFGESVAVFFAHAQPWLLANASRIFGGDGGQTSRHQVALSTALATHNFHPKLLEVLRGPIAAALMRGQPLAVGWAYSRSPERLIGDWIVHAYIVGGISKDDDLMHLFFDQASVDLRGDVLGHIGWQLMEADSVRADILKKTGDLWDWRAAKVEERPSTSKELKDFFWYVKSGKFSAGWWVPRLNQALVLSPRPDIGGLIHEQLAEASKQYPGPVLSIVRSLVAGAVESRGDQYMLIEHAVPQIIASALDSVDPEIGAEATAFMHELGERGYIDLDASVAVLRQH